jgi:hypothetical protein
MNLTNYIISSYSNNLRLLKMEKQSQTKPILPAVPGKIALSEVEGPIVINLSRAQSRDLSKQLPASDEFKEEVELKSFFHFVVVHYEAIADVGNGGIRDSKAELFISVDGISIILIYRKSYLRKAFVSCERFNKF